MPVEDDQTVWRTIFCKDPTHTLVTTYPNPGTAHTVVQNDPTKLLCTTTPSAITAQKVIQSDASLLKITNTPDGETVQPVSQGAAIQGIWPAPGSTRVQGNGFQSGSGSAIVYTVPANKKLYFHNAQLTIYTTADANVYGRMMVRNDSDVAQYRVMDLYQILIGSSSLSESYSPALEALAGWDVYMYATNAEVVVRGLIHGWLEDA